MKYNIKLKTGEDLENLREACRRVARVVRLAGEMVAPGVTTKEINDFVYKTITDMGDTPAFLNYQPFGADYPYPGSICISVNDEVVHGIGSDRVLKEGDIVGLDCGVKHKGMISDHCITFPVGKISDAHKQLLIDTKKVLSAGIDSIAPGKFVNDISKAIEKATPKKYGIVTVLSGHGVGYHVHEEPYVPNFDDGVKGPKLEPGMVLAIEPMLCMGTGEVYLEEDGYTFKTEDGKYAAHFEHTVLITDEGAEILTL